MRMKVSVMIVALTVALVFVPGLMAQQASGSPGAQEQPQSPTPQATPERNPEQQQTPESQNGQKAGDSSSSQAMQQPAMKSFSGTIVKISDQYVLQDTSTNTKYELDNQSTAKQYEGKEVVVTGSLDANSVIHVESIELLK